jgi:hypothetical protein
VEPEGEQVRPLDYQSPLMPAGARLTFTEYPDGGKLTRDGPRPAELLREAVAPVFAIALLAGGVAFGTWRAFQLWRPDRPHAQSVVSAGGAAAGMIALVYVLLDSWQNSGVVTVVEVRGAWLTWTKHNFWGARRQRWRTADVVGVSTRGIGDLMLRVAHRRRVPLGAFSTFTLPELQAAAALMTLALERARRASGDDAGVNAAENEDGG